MTLKFLQHLLFVRAIAAATVARMSFGNKIGFEFKNELTAKNFFTPLSVLHC